jgi:hypothetical protein
MFAADLKWKWCKTMEISLKKMKDIFLKGNSAKKIHNDMLVTLGDIAPSQFRSQGLG